MFDPFDDEQVQTFLKLDYDQMSTFELARQCVFLTGLVRGQAAKINDLESGIEKLEYDISHLHFGWSGNEKSR